MTAPTPRPGILDIKPYVPGASPEKKGGPVYKLSSNESALGPSPKAMEAYRGEADSLHLYPDGSATVLRRKLAALHDLDADRIVCGAGSDELLQLLTKAYVGEGDNIVQTRHGFLVYALAAKSCGAEPRFAPEKNLAADVDAILEQVDERTRIVFLANPNNPTGTYIPDSEVRRLRSELRDDIILVIDAAYAEYMEEPDYADGAAMVQEHDNVVMTRTFSKIYGLGALRIGWAYCPADIAGVLNRIRGPFNVGAPSIAAGAAAVDDHDFVNRNRAFNREQRDWYMQQLAALKLDAVRSYGNFILVKFPDAPGKRAADALAHLKANGVMVRDVVAYGLPEYLRISIGEEAANRRCIELLGEMYGER